MEICGGDKHGSIDLGQEFSPLAGDLSSSKQEVQAQVREVSAHVPGPSYGLDDPGAEAYGFDHDKSPEHLFCIDDGIDIGFIVSYLRHLDGGGKLRISTDGMKVGKIELLDSDQLDFINDETGETEAISANFLASKTRAIIGSFLPVHAVAMRRNTDNSWTEVDSAKVAQPVHRNLADRLREMIHEQATRHRGAASVRNFSLQAVFL